MSSSQRRVAGSERWARWLVTWMWCRVIPAVDGLHRVRIGARAGDRRIGVRVLDARPQLLFGQTAADPRELLLVGQFDAEAALGRGGDQRPVVVQGRIDVDGDAHDEAVSPTMVCM